uniref:Uncharacterized protein n=1 Tax=Arundo donax TaxID=35708 RepID=A0A0A9EPF2_ARUDO
MPCILLHEAVSKQLSHLVKFEKQMFHHLFTLLYK